jgi:hypothetical protein
MMKMAIVAALGVTCFALPAGGDEPPRLGGLWRLSAFYAEDIASKERTDIYGPRPIGYMGVDGNGNFDAWAMSAEGTSGRLVARRAVFYSGSISVHGNSAVVRIDKAEHQGFYPDPIHVIWNEFKTSVDDVRSFVLERDELRDEILRLDTAPYAEPNGSGKQIVGKVVWVRTHEWDERSR